MIESSLLQNIFGTIGTILWSAQIVPQIYQNYKTKSTFGLSPYLMLIWTLAAFFLGVYNILQNINVALIVQPQSFGFMGALCWVQCLYYGDGPDPDPAGEHYVDPKRKRREPMSLKRTLVIFTSYILFAAAFECGFVYILRATAKGDPPVPNQAGVQFFGIAAAVLISLGLMPQYYEIFRLRRVVGVSYIFMTVDLLGGVFSTLSLAFKEKWDITASINYTLVILLDGVVLLLAAILNPIADRRVARIRARNEDLERQGESKKSEEKPPTQQEQPRDSVDVGLGSGPTVDETVDPPSEIGTLVDLVNSRSSQFVGQNSSSSHLHQIISRNASSIFETHNPHGV